MIGAPTSQIRISPFRQERGDNFFETRITPQWIPMRIEANLHVTDAPRHFCGSLEPLDGEVALAYPGTNDSIIIKDVRGIERFLFRTRKLNRVPTFAQGFFFSSEGSID